MQEPQIFDTIETLVPSKRITIRIDDEPYQVDFFGVIDIERLESGDVAIRRVSEDAQLDVTRL